MPSSANKRVAKNTAILYVRMLFLTAISLYTVRITLKALGVVDYGIYNVLASVVGALSILTGALTSATQRFLAFHLGRNDYKAYSKTFSLLLIGFAIISVILIIIGEILGIFFVNDWLTIPPDRLYAAKWVYQTSIFTFIMGLLVIPFSSSIIANEKMNAFAYISILDGVLRLIVVYLLMLSPVDRLIYYGILTLVCSVIILLAYVVYCHRAFPHCRFSFVWDKALFKELTSYTGWNMFGSLSGILATQGQNVMLNIFFGPVVNTAKAIADKISHTIQSFSTNFYMAVSPQIIKSYASGDTDRMFNLANKSSRISFFLVLVISFPLMTCIESILNLWLGSASVSTIMIRFSNLIFIYCLVGTLEQPLTQMIRATGKIRNYQIKVGMLTLSYIPVASLVLYLGCSAEFSLIVLIVINALTLGVRLKISRSQLNFNVPDYLRRVILPILTVSALAVVLYLSISRINLSGSITTMIIRLLLGFVSISVVIWFVGLDKSDREYVLGMIKRKV